VISPYDLLIAPFAEFVFMRRALVGGLALALGAAPLGVFLVLRRMSLVGDALSHAILPGAALGFLLAGLSIWWMSLGGLVAGLLVAGLSGLMARTTTLKEDASFAGFYVLALALGVMLVSRAGTPIDLIRALFGSALAVDDAALWLMAAVASLTLLGLAALYRALVVECLDPGFLKTHGGGLGTLAHLGFLGLLVLNLVAAFHALGTLMAIGLLVLPATAARFWAETVWTQMLVAAAIALTATVVGLLLSFHLDLPSGPAIVLSAGALYLLSVAVGARDSLYRRHVQSPHLRA